ncbi:MULTISPECIES: flagellar biosynthesis protein FlhB [Pelosinus]|uniref:Flagellar biosynthetic protein FlhB n=1 Tax=Pelosinus fermentans B4 TaxID=1149862 RepID=I9AZ72_9FIRM|nr:MULTISPECIES: flagellar biosynthesis protein FlhB [Pelosinus]EIW18197.1 flagellar biosynthetic protein FlhB [Pelosinus fermentans B4]EIW24001.1 flagellar biosynthetic protein FlhB [Pelosinus fermentans A11]OAM94071.1 flagellar biosynthetic protein FlhB [Pelosinus fermentans DSM 17108]SDQ98954.1 flagellar biosynthetic protein FlhB [Pelosinus fermentans]
MGCIKIFSGFFPCSNKAQLQPFSKSVSFDLQLFAGEKTEEATAKRKGEARQKGQVAKSTEVNSVFIILAAFFTLKLIGSYIYDELTRYMQLSFSNVATADMTINSIREIFLGFAIVFIKTALPVMCVILIVSLTINFIQVGFLFSFEPLMPKLSKLNPIAGFGRLFSKRSLVELVKSLLKITIIGYFIYRFMRKQIEQIPGLISAELIDSLHIAASLILNLVFQISAVMLVLAAFDYFYQWWEHKESLKMSKDDIKQEFKQSEGDPLIKGKIKQRQRAMSMQRMMQEVPKADVIVTNPTHFAVALKYEKAMAAPIVVAKGQDLIAQRIKEIAKENKVIIVENKVLARALYAAVDIGYPVPPELYQAVAEVLAYVYKLKKRLS